MRWSKLKQRVEDRIAPSLQRRVQVYSTWYRCLGHDRLGRVWITVDKREVANMSDWPYWIDYSDLVDEIRATISAPDHCDPAQLRELSAASGKAETILHRQGRYSRYQAQAMLKRYLSLTIDDALRSDEMLIRAFAMLDSRVGKRRLRTLHLGDDEHPLVRQFYALRCEAESIKPQTAVA